MASEKWLIDANALIQNHGNDVTNWDKPYAVKISSIENAPTVDAVEVVRCKDCKHWKPSGSMAGNSEDDLQPIGGCEWANCCRRANDFCSYGERKDNG